MQATSNTAPPWGMFRLGLLLLTAVLASGEARVANALPPVPASASGRYAEVTVEPTDTSIYVGTVSLIMPPFTRRGDVYRSDYVIKVFPFFFYNERGNIWIEFSDDQLRHIERGETVFFNGRATNSDGEGRGIKGRAVPEAAGADYGKIKVWVRVSKRIELIFNAVYRFTGRE